MSRLRREQSSSKQTLVNDEDITESDPPPSVREMSSVLEHSTDDITYSNNVEGSNSHEKLPYSSSEELPENHVSHQEIYSPPSRVLPVAALAQKQKYFSVEPVIALYSLAYAMSQPLTMEFIHHRLIVSNLKPRINVRKEM